MRQVVYRELGSGRRVGSARRSAKRRPASKGATFGGMLTRLGSASDALARSRAKVAR